MKRPFRLLALSCGLLTWQTAWPLGASAEDSILTLRQTAAMNAAARDATAFHEPVAGNAAYDVAMLQPAGQLISSITAPGTDLPGAFSWTVTSYGGLDPVVAMKSW